MTLFKKFIGFVALAAVVFACKKEMSSENAQGPVVVETKWEFKESETLFQGNIDTAFISKQPGFSVLTIEGKSINENNGILLMQIGTDSLAKGTYASDDLYFQYSENGAVLYESVTGDANFNFSITIDKLDSASISGTFGGVVVGGDSLPRNIVEGKFAAELVGGTIVGPGPDTIPDPYPDSIPEPDPNADFLPLGSVWTYGNLNDPDNDTLKITSMGDTTVDDNGNTYTRFYNDMTGQTRYFRKDTAIGLYYEYVMPSETYRFEAPVEITILDENVAVGGSWESGEYTFIFTAAGPEIRIPVKISNTITNFYSDYVINGKNYHDVYEVLTNMLVKQDDGSFADSGSLAITYFARGIGIVEYNEVANGELYGIRHYNVTP